MLLSVFLVLKYSYSELGITSYCQLKNNLCIPSLENYEK